jgi:hypothetical protein
VSTEICRRAATNRTSAAFTPSISCGPSSNAVQRLGREHLAMQGRRERP